VSGRVGRGADEEVEVEVMEVVGTGGIEEISGEEVLEEEDHRGEGGLLGGRSELFYGVGGGVDGWMDGKVAGWLFFICFARFDFLISVPLVLSLLA